MGEVNALLLQQMRPELPCSQGGLVSPAAPGLLARQGGVGQWVRRVCV
jgi:hypothetical protein